jgi:hypothetical protein
MTLHVENIPTYITSRQLVAAFESYGPVISAELTLEPETSRSTGHALVTMADPEAVIAERCLAGVHWGAARLNVRAWRGEGCKKCLENLLDRTPA